MTADDAEWGVLVESSLLALLDAAEEGILAFDAEAQCRMIGRRAGELFGINPADYAGRSRDEVLQALARSSDEPELFLKAVGVEDLNDPPHAVAEVEIVRPRPRRLVWSTSPLLEEGKVVGRLILLRDVTRERGHERRNKELVARLEELLPNDGLTGLLNRRRFLEDLEREHGRSIRAWDSYAIVRVDIDGMGEINDRFGLLVGDKVLQKVAECMNKGRREYDVIARYENDEMVALLPSADAVAARTVGERFARTVFGHDFQLPDVKVTVSVGCAVWEPPSTEDGEDIVGRAGAVLVRGRGWGKGGVHVDGGEGAKKA